MENLEKTYGKSVTPEDFFAYTYVILFSPQYVKQFWNELFVPGPRLPITKDVSLFEKSVSLGKQLIWLHTYGERFVPQGKKIGRVPPGKARCTKATPKTKEKYPNTFRYDEAEKALYVGEGIFSNIRPEVWSFSVSGLQIIKSWLGYRMKERSGKSSSPLDDIRPEIWTFDDELLDLLWVLDNTIDLLSEVNQNFENVLKSSLFTIEDLPKPSDKDQHSKGALSLFDYAGINIEQEDEEKEE